LCNIKKHDGRVKIFSLAFSLKVITDSPLLLGKGKALPVLAWTGPEGSICLRLTDFKTVAHGSGKVVSPLHQSPLPPKKYSWYAFLLEAESTPEAECSWKDYVNEKFQKDTTRNQTCDFLASSAVPQPTSPPHALPLLLGK